ncbi:MAG: hypothetical protein C0424_05280 [Sphingobacteriaceae bacterium]|nr:hypothetical protein [Sphingobacteriaceae bacterium]
MKKVLIVEDELQLRENIVELFQASDYEVMAAENGSEGYLLAQKHLPDLIVSDVIMPVEDGFSMLSRIRSNPATELTPVVFLTAKNMVEAKVEGLELGADDYVVKPFAAAELLARAANLVQKHEKLLKKSLLTVKTEDIQPKPELLVKEIIDFIEENLGNFNLSVDMVAKHLQISKSTVQRKLKAAVDKNLNQLIREYRLEKARKMIERQAGSLSEIAIATGFNSLSYFSYSYKKYYGTAPSQLKR